jgi:hypothetical protein
VSGQPGSESNKQLCNSARLKTAQIEMALLPKKSSQFFIKAHGLSFVRVTCRVWRGGFVAVDFSLKCP